MFSLAEIAKDFITELLFGSEIPDFFITGHGLERLMPAVADISPI